VPRFFVVAGATGRTGKAIAASLLARGHRVRAIVHREGSGDELRAHGAEVIVASLGDERALDRALAGAAGFYALLPEEPAVADFHAHRRRMADAMAKAVRQARVPHVVFLSALAAALAEGNGPASDLHYAEAALRATRGTLTILRSSYFLDNVLGAADLAQREGIYTNFFASADTPLPTVATRDVGLIAARSLLEPPPASEIVDVIGPAYSVRDFAAHLSRALGTPVQVVDIPPAAHVATLTRAGIPPAFAEILAEMFACLASGRVSPQGDRVERGTTELDSVLATQPASRRAGPPQRGS